MKYLPRLTTILVPLLVLFAVYPLNFALGEPLDEYTEIEKSRSVEERRILVSLQEERARVKEQLTILAGKETELKTLQSEVDKQLSALKRIRVEVQKLLAQKEAKEQANVIKLSKMYEKMEPSKAAQVLVTLDKELAVDILTHMKQKSAGKILNNINTEKAATLSVTFSSLEMD